jgi:hypothetical protein
MIDTEVMRLRRLRNTALKARALAAALDAALDSDPARRSSVFSRSAVTSWRIARVITGWLRAHPYLSYQRGPSAVRGVYDRLNAGLLSTIARYRGRSAHIFSRELRRVARGLDDARALTWSSDLSDSLGRSQMQIRTLIQELDADAHTADAHQQVASRHEAPARVEKHTADGRDDAGSVAENWPYLAI